MRRKMAVFLTALLSVGLFASSASISEADVVEKENRSNITGSVDSYSASSGSVSQVNISARLNSNNWAGIYGNASGRYILGSSQNSIFSWGSSKGKYVYLSEESINFSSEWHSRNNSDMVSEYGFVEGGIEGVSNTFRHSYVLDSVFQNQGGINTTAAKTLDGSGNSSWVTAYLSDGENGFFAGVVDSGYSYTGEKSEYQMILPEQGLNSQPTSYSIWIEIE